jgi:sulfotransferase family protein
VTLLSAWSSVGDDRAGAREGDREGCFQCDLCFPPRLMIGSPSDLRAAGWRIDDVSTGPHACPTCVRRATPISPTPLLRHVDMPHIHWDPGALPNLVVIGAPKCGTTSLHHYLGLHPEIQMSSPKELGFFHDPRSLERLDFYARYFDPAIPVRGESTTTYSWDPVIPGVPERIRRALGEVKLIYLVRDPVDRAFASYLEEVTHEMELRTVEEAFSTVEGRFNRYVAASRYATQLEGFLEHFPARDVLVIDQSDLRDRRSETLGRIFRFVGVDDAFTTPAFQRVIKNPTSEKRSRTPLGRNLRKTVLARVITGLPHGIREAALRPIRRILSARVEMPPLDSALRERLALTLGDEMARFRELTGIAPDRWSSFQGVEEMPGVPDGPRDGPIPTADAR